MELIFTNKLGTLKFKGNGTDDFSICEIEGLTPCEKSRILKNYIGEDGVFEQSSQYTSRIISFSGDICNNCEEKFKKASKILSKEGTLIVDHNGCKRQIKVNYATIKMGKRYNNYCTYAVALTCDYPHFTDITQEVRGVFAKTEYLTKDSVLPMIFSERISRGVVNNNGDLVVYPVIVIKKEVETDNGNLIEIINETTGKSLRLRKVLALNEEIVIDVKNRTVVSNISGNAIETLDFYSSLKDMWCECGENVISVLVNDNQKGIKVLVKYYNEYLEAI